MRRPRSGYWFPGLIIVVLGAVTSAAGDDRTLRWKFEKGQTRLFVLTQKQTTEMLINGNKAQNNFILTTFATWRVKSVDTDGTADVTQTIDRIKFQLITSPPGKNFEVDSAEPHDALETPEKYAKAFRSVVGSEFTARITKRGEFRDVKVPAKLVGGYKQVDPQGRVLGDEESLKYLFSNAVVVLPEAAAEQGTSWKVRRSVPIEMGTIVMDNTFTIMGAMGPVQNIAVRGKAKVEPTAGSTFEIELKSQEQSGQYRFDNSAGVMRLSEITQKFSINLTVGGHAAPTEIAWSLKMELKNDRELN